MILLDSNHLVVLRYPEGARYGVLANRMRASDDQRFAVPVVALEEQLRGWLAVIHRAMETHAAGESEGEQWTYALRQSP